MTHTPRPGRPPVRWIKASKSAYADACVELAPAEEGFIALRDSKDPEGPVLRFTEAELDAFIDGAKRGEFDHLLSSGPGEVTCPSCGSPEPEAHPPSGNCPDGFHLPDLFARLEREL